MDPIEQLLQKASLIEERLKYSFHDRQLLLLAFVHRSFYNEHRDLLEAHNERLEFLGDSVLGLIVSDFLYNHLPKHAEGELSHLRAHFVGASSCAAFLQQLDLAEFVLLGKGERLNQGRGRERILADLFEALVGAIYLDGGLLAAKQFLLSHFDEALIASALEPQRNWKADLQDYSQRKYQKLPSYKLLDQSGPDHSKRFLVAVFVGEKEVGRGEGPSKKQAEAAAACNALTQLESHG
jgi:ribonuclease-3